MRKIHPALILMCASGVLMSCTPQDQLPQPQPEFIDLDLSKGTYRGNTITLHDLDTSSLGPGHSFLIRNGVFGASNDIQSGIEAEQRYLDQLCHGKAGIRYASIVTTRSGAIRFNAVVECK